MKATITEKKTSEIEFTVEDLKVGQLAFIRGDVIIRGEIVGLALEPCYTYLTGYQTGKTFKTKINKCNVTLIDLNKETVTLEN